MKGTECNINLFLSWRKPYLVSTLWLTVKLLQNTLSDGWYSQGSSTGLRQYRALGYAFVGQWAQDTMRPPSNIRLEISWLTLFFSRPMGCSPLSPWLNLALNISHISHGLIRHCAYHIFPMLGTEWCQLHDCSIICVWGSAVLVSHIERDYMLCFGQPEEEDRSVSKMWLSFYLVMWWLLLKGPVGQPRGL